MISLIVAVLGLICILYFFITKPSQATIQKPKEPSKGNQSQAPKQKLSYGPLLIFYGTQTGTAAKMAETFSVEAQENGFNPEVIDLKDASPDMFDDIVPCIFLLSNTGEGEPPDNTVRFMNVLREKDPQEFDFTNVKFSVFGLGNTQYQFFNKIGKDVDALLEKRGAKRIFQIGLGDNNASLEDDFNDWKLGLWKPLKQVSKSMTIKSNGVQSAIDQKPSNHLAGFKFIKTDEPEFVIGNQFHHKYELEFLTKNYLHSKPAKIREFRQVRQNTNDGSSVHIEFQLQQKKPYKTAANLAIYPENDPVYIQKVIKHFKLDMQSTFDVKIEKKSKLNFFTPTKMKTLITNYIDLQNPINKSILKSLAKLPSKNQAYFLQNCAPKSTAQYIRLTKKFTTLIQLIQQFEVDITFETFVSISNAIAPRLFTIASSHKFSQNIAIVDSIEQNGLCSKFLINKSTKEARVQVRDSSFNDAMKNQKAIFVAAGTGLAPFIGYFQEKQLLLKQNKPTPLISLVFGCKHENGDFIYRQQIQNWIKLGVINKFYPAFSRDQEKKVYVQDRIGQNHQELKQLFASATSTLYCCGSTQMGKSVVEEIVKFFVKQGKSQQEANKLLLKYETEHKIIKQLW